jgi:hypothetical protein
MRTLTLIASVSFLLLGCGDDDGHTHDEDSGTGTDAATAMDTGTETDSATATDTGTETDSATATDTGPEPDSGPAAVDIQIEDFNAFANCKPIVGPDPIRAFWNTVVTNSTGSAVMLTVEDAILHIDSAARDEDEHFDVDPSSINATPGESTTMQSKTGSDMPAPMGCMLCAGGMATLEITFMVPGTGLVTVNSAASPFTCAL